MARGKLDKLVQGLWNLEIIKTFNIITLLHIFDITKDEIVAGFILGSCSGTKTVRKLDEKSNFWAQVLNKKD